MTRLYASLCVEDATTTRTARSSTALSTGYVAHGVTPWSTWVVMNSTYQYNTAWTIQHHHSRISLREALHESDIENVLGELAKVSSVSVLDYLQNEADLTVDKNYRKWCIQCLCETARRYQALPPKLFLRDIEKEQSSWPLRGGGFADIWKGRSTSNGRSLCLKVLRMFAESDEVRKKKTNLNSATKLYFGDSSTIRTFFPS
ncbi:hypothetical protein PM082_016602 [Marasmius tenuissimus]|nr:hypothetical protein PM082_016602 [Marasmius tenuissimus]